MAIARVEMASRDATAPIQRLQQIAAHVGVNGAPVSVPATVAHGGGGVQPQAQRQQQQPQRFGADADTVALWRFDEGSGNACHEASDPELTLRAHKQALWGHVEGLGPVLRFQRGSNDDANVLVGPVNHDATELRRCPDEYTVEVWARYTGPWSAELGGDHPRTAVQICGTDEDGFSLPSGKRCGWSFSLHDGVRDLNPQDGRLMPHARNLGEGGHRDFSGLTGLDGTRGPFYCGLADPSAVSREGLEDEGWHHVAWQWRKLDESHWLFVDGKLVWSGRAPETRVVGPVGENTIPFMVGGVVHSQDPPFYLGWCSFEGEMASLRISRVMRLPVADSLRIVPTYSHMHLNERGGPATKEQKVIARAHPASLPDAVLGAPYHAAVIVEGGVAVSFELVAPGAALPRGLEFDDTHGIVQGVSTEACTCSFTIVATGADGKTADPQPFTLCVVEPQVATRTLPPAIGGRPYTAALESGNLVHPVRWSATGVLPSWLSLGPAEGLEGDETITLRGTPPDSSVGSAVAVELSATDARGIVDQISLELRVLPKHLRDLVVDEHTQALWCENTP